MNANKEAKEPVRSWFNFAAWAGLFIPFAALTATIVISSLSGHTNFLPAPSRQFSGDLRGSALLVDLGSLVLAVVSLFGIKRHGAACILWKAVPGVFTSGILGFYHFAMMMMSSIIC